MLTVSSFKAGCGGSSPDLPGGYDDIGINVTLKIPDDRNPKGKIVEIEVPLFIALLGRQDNVLDRQDEALKIKVSDYAFSQAYKITYHPPKGTDPTSPSHKILVGFNGTAIKDLPPRSIAPSFVKKKLFPKKKLNKSLKNKKVKKKKLHKSLKNKHVKKAKPKNRRVKTKKVRQWRQ